jgi:hypothetical protein
MFNDDSAAAVGDSRVISAVCGARSFRSTGRGAGINSLVGIVISPQFLFGLGAVDETDGGFRRQPNK